MLIKPNSRSWQMPLMAAFAVGIPAFIGAWLQHPSEGILAGMGGMTFLYMHQMQTARIVINGLLTTLAFCTCFAVGALGSFNQMSATATLFLVAAIFTVICQRYKVPPPGSFFFVLITAIAITLPFKLALLPLRLMLVASGGLLASIIAFIYQKLLSKTPIEATVTPSKSAEVLIREALIVGLFVAGSFLLAELLKFHNPYWVPISCAAVMQGLSFKAIWHRKVHRILGTVVGMGLTWLVFHFILNPMQVAMLIFVLIFLVEILIVRNYALAVIFITPLTVLFAESSSIGISADALALTRLSDIILGSAFGLIGGWFLRPKQVA